MIYVNYDIYFGIWVICHYLVYILLHFDLPYFTRELFMGVASNDALTHVRLKYFRNIQPLTI